MNSAPHSQSQVTVEWSVPGHARGSLGTGIEVHICGSAITSDLKHQIHPKSTKLLSSVPISLKEYTSVQFKSY